MLANLNMPALVHRYGFSLPKKGQNDDVTQRYNYVTQQLNDDVSKQRYTTTLHNDVTQ